MLLLILVKELLPLTHTTKTKSGKHRNRHAKEITTLYTYL